MKRLKSSVQRNDLDHYVIIDDQENQTSHWPRPLQQPPGGVTMVIYSCVLDLCDIIDRFLKSSFEDDEIILGT